MITLIALFRFIAMKGKPRNQNRRKKNMNPNTKTTVRNSISSISVVEPIPQLAIRLAGEGSPTVVVGGMTAPEALEVNWGKVIDTVLGLLGGWLGGGDGGGGGGGGKGCTTIKITNSDGSSTTIQQCSSGAHPA